MQSYKNLSGNSTVESYQSDSESITVNCEIQQEK